MKKFMNKVKNIFADKSGSGYVDQAVVILISVVVGALLLGGLYALFGDTLLPTVQQRVVEMFDFAG